MPKIIEHGVKSDDAKGWIFLFKNDKLIRDRPFHNRNTRRKFMKEFLTVCKTGTEDSYYIDIKLDLPNVRL